jgi:hypothetical protein
MKQQNSKAILSPRVFGLSIKQRRPDLLTFKRPALAAFKAESNEQVGVHSGTLLCVNGANINPLT